MEDGERGRQRTDIARKLSDSNSPKKSVRKAAASVRARSTASLRAEIGQARPP